MRKTVALIISFLLIFCALPVCGASAELTSVEFVKAPKRTEYIVGEFIDLRGAVLRLKFSNGDYEDFEISKIDYYSSDDGYYLNQELYSEYLGQGDNIRLGVFQFDRAETRRVKFECFGKYFAYEFKVSENLATSIRLTNTVDKNCQITMFNSDGTSTIANALEFNSWYVITDNGIYDMDYYCSSDGAFYVEMENNSTGRTITSNTLTKCDYYNTLTALDKYRLPIYFASSEFDSFNGDVTPENVDGLIVLVAEYKNFPRVGLTATCTAEELASAFEEVYGIENADLTMSSFYNSDDGKFRITWGGYGGGGLAGYSSPIEIDYISNKWVLNPKSMFNDSIEAYIELDDELKLRYINFDGYRYGDVNGDYSTNISDLFTLKMMLIRGDAVNVASDINGDSSINISDLFALKQMLIG